MRIVLATETFLPHVDGIVTRLTKTVAQLRAAGDDVLIIAPWRPNSPAEFEGARVVTVPSQPFPRSPDVRVGLPLLPPRVQRILHDFKPDLIHVASPAAVGFGAVLYAKLRNIPLVESYHVRYAEYVKHYKMDFLYSFAWWYSRVVHNRARLNLATSLPMVRELKAHGVRRVALWRPGVDFERFTPALRNDEMRSRLAGGHPDDFVIVCVARLAPEKEIDRLAPVLRAVPGVRLALVGDGPAKPNLERVFAGLPVTFMGMLYGGELAAAYASADVFVLPSSSETLGLVALEAMAAGVPAIVANRGGLPDLVIDGQTGFLFDPDAADDLATRVLALKSAPERRQEMARTARMHAERFSWAQTTRQLRGYYRRVLKGVAMVPAEDGDMEDEDDQPTIVLAEHEAE
jgi:glycosyltransferase involved in cell wall biosynthesis